MRSEADLCVGSSPHIPTNLTVISVVHNMEMQCERRKTDAIHAQQNSGAWYIAKLGFEFTHVKAFTLNDGANYFGSPRPESPNQSHSI